VSRGPVFRFTSACRARAPTFPVYHVVRLHSSGSIFLWHDPSTIPSSIRCKTFVHGWSQKGTAPPRNGKKASKVSGLRRTTGVACAWSGGHFLFSIHRLALIPAPWFTPREGRPSQLPIPRFPVPASGVRAAGPVSVGSLSDGAHVLGTL
jgi:hypothetical protein